MPDARGRSLRLWAFRQQRARPGALGTVDMEFRQYRLKPGALGTVDMEYKDKNDMVCAGCQGRKFPSLGIRAQRANPGALGIVHTEYKDKRTWCVLHGGFSRYGAVWFYFMHGREAPGFWKGERQTDRGGGLR